MRAPPYQPRVLSPGLSIQGPLTRDITGSRPGLVIIQDATTSAASDQSPRKRPPTLDPEPLQKWAEEGFVVARIQLHEGSSIDERDLQQALEAIDNLTDGTEASGPSGKVNTAGNIGIIAYSAWAISALCHALDSGWTALDRVKAIVCFGSLDTDTSKPHLCHLAEQGATKATDGENVWYRYPEAQSPSFVLPRHEDYLPASAAVSHTRSLHFLKKHLDGPWFDLEAIWEEHTRLEFAARAVEDTMDTMVEEPYVNHVPTMTGGIGRRNLTGFYAKHFIFSNPDDTELQLISRTVGIDRVVDEFIFALTHDRVIDWLLPGIPPTGKKLRIPFTAVVNIRGDRLYHEHIAWDQLTVLFQLGLMPEYLPFPYPVGMDSHETGKKLEYRVPGAGHEIADKVVDESAVPSNIMFEYAVRQTKQ